MRKALLLLGWLGLGCGGRVAELPSGAALGGAASVGGASAVGGAATSQPVKLTPLTDEQVANIFLVACNGWAVEDEVWVPKIQWVVDSSASMADVATGALASKWALTREALQDAFALVNAKAANLCVSGLHGMLVYPHRQTDGLFTGTERPVDTCIDTASMLAPRRIASNSAVDWEPFASLLDSTVPEGGTPILDAYRYAFEDPDDPYYYNEFVVLVTDGMPTIAGGCQTPVPDPTGTNLWPTTSTLDQTIVSVEPIIAEVESARAKGLRTIVVGTPGSDAARAWLSRAAVAGGTALAGCDPNGNAPYCHLDMTLDPDAMNSVAEVVFPGGPPTSCRYSIPNQSADGLESIIPSSTKPLIRDASGQTWLVPLDQGPAENCTEGFRIENATELELCPAACAFLNGDCHNSISILILCEPSDEWQLL